MSEQRLEGFAKAKTATPFIASEQEGQDNIFGFGQAQFVIPQLLRDLKEKIRSRNKSGMTVIYCHSETIAEGSQNKILKRVQDDKLVSEAHSKELNVLTSYRLNDFKKKAGATHVDLSGNIRRVAFTLAEVLITLAIIGVVAAMTIPTLIANYQERAWNTASLVFQRKRSEHGILRL